VNVCDNAVSLFGLRALLAVCSPRINCVFNEQVVSFFIFVCMYVYGVLCVCVCVCVCVILFFCVCVVCGCARVFFFLFFSLFHERDLYVY
jgi:hypothetical protein